MGVLNLRTQNEALLLKYLHKFFNRADLPWVQLIWEKYYSNGPLPNTRKKRLILVERHLKIASFLQRLSYGTGERWNHMFILGGSLA